MPITDTDTDTDTDTRTQPRGRKGYLHHPADQVARRWWESRDQDSKHDKQRLCCDPIARDQVFWFHIDADNLSAAELDLLCVAIEPAPGFLHRLGLGKPLGLGSVRIEIAAILTQDRKARYSPAAIDETGRYHRAYLPDRHQPPELPARYRSDLDAIDTRRRLALADLPRSDRLVDPDSRDILARIGDPNALQAHLWVHHPLMAHQLPIRADPGAESEQKTYQWHVHNQPDKNRRPFAPLPVSPSAPLPALPVLMRIRISGFPGRPSGEEWRQLDQQLKSEGALHVKPGYDKCMQTGFADCLFTAAQGWEALPRLERLTYQQIPLKAQPVAG